MRYRQIAVTVALTLSGGCAEPSKTVAGDITLTRFETGYYLRHPGVETERMGFGPLESLGWTSETSPHALSALGAGLST